jgi:hypothetical protein
MNAKHLGEQLHAKRSAWQELWNSKPDRSFTDDEISTLTQLNTEMTDISKKYEMAVTLEATADQVAREAKEYNTPVNRLETPQAPQQKPQYKSFGTLLNDWRGFGAFRSGEVKSIQMEIPDATLARDFGMKTLLTSGDWDIVADRQPQTVPSVQLEYTDVPMMESYIRERLAFMVQQRREYQLINGDGTAPNISGILDRSGIQTQAKGADPTPDAVYKAMTKVRVTGGAEPTAFVVHPNDWQDIRLLRTSDGIYIWGSPADAAPSVRAGVPALWHYG